jgi:hypothetical protein
MLANMVQAWISAILKPIDCVLSSLETVIRKLKFSGSKIADQFKINMTTDIGIIGVGDSSLGLAPPELDLKEGFNIKGTGKKYNDTTGLSEDTKNALKALDNEKFMESAALRLESYRKWLTKHRDLVFAFMNKYIEKFKSALSHTTKSMTQVAQSIKDIQELIAQFFMITTVLKIFQAKITLCGKDDAIQQTPSDVPGEIAKNHPEFGYTTFTDEGTGDRLTEKAISLPKEEADALGLKVPDEHKNSSGLPSPSISSSITTDASGNVVYRIVRNFNEDCGRLVTRESFYDVNTLIRSL